MPANFFIASSHIFSAECKILSHIINGKTYDVNKDYNDLKAGTYRLLINKMAPFELTISLQKDKYSGEIKMGEEKFPVQVTYSKPNITLAYSLVKDKKEPTNILTGYVVNDTIKGFSTLSYGSSATWSATLTNEYIKPDTAIVKKSVPPIPSLLYPFQAFGFDTLPQPKTVLFKNTTVWTNEKDGILRNTDVLISNGKISAIGKNLSSANALVIDGTGKHLTAGIIDEHSHIAIYKGVNEGTQSVTAEVRIGDVLLPNDINIYRQLAGGVTSSHLLHGSANAIGGQTQLIKLRWGYSAEQMKFAGWPGFIKFALGENVKQSNWGDLNKVRFPQTRMGVEQIITDAFNRAKVYAKKWDDYNKLNSKQKSITPAPRRDLELDALVEILNKQRFITCHSYVQSEINMLMHVADKFGFTVNTFTHILEGYKVADKMKRHGAGASSFSDWWAYKYEVIDAIPYNGAILSQMGIITAFNSDDAEMARRLNQEAAKAVMYGGLSEEEAWKLVTLNPAKLLHVDQYTGSIKVGKDADVVLWSGNPLSMYSKAEQTYVDGICFFSLEDNEKKIAYIKTEKERLLKLMLEAKQNGSSTQPINIQINQLYHCDTEGDFVK
jgi:imidazolonepropionase-like amidohydrolase